MNSCPDCGKCEDCAEAMCMQCYYCIDCAEELCAECGEYCSDCVDICSECGVCDNCSTICGDCELCEDCCEAAADKFNCDHGICVMSDEWKSHYCTAGNHCIESSNEYGSDESGHWNICDEGCDVKLNSAHHSFGRGTVTAEATEDSEGELKFSCVICGYEKTEAIPKLEGGHTHSYTETVTPATCTSEGYTTHTCSCGHSWTDDETPARSHNYKQRSDETSHWKECEYCGKISNDGTHRFSSWATVTKPGYTYEGEKQRTCSACGHVATEAIPRLTVPNDKVVITYPSYPDTGKQPDDKDPDAPTVPSTAPYVEVLTKGEDNTVPALPTLPPTEDGNIFEGWVDKATGETVQKGDKISRNIELEPKWRDCGEGNHVDSDGDNACDECGFIMKKETEPAETDDPAVTDPSETTPTETTDTVDEPGDTANKMPTFVIVALSLFGAAVIVCGAVLVSISRKKSKVK